MRRTLVCLLGHGGAGKTAIATRFLRNNFQEEYDPNIGTAPIGRHRGEGGDVAATLIRRNRRRVPQGRRRGWGTQHDRVTVRPLSLSLFLV